MFQRLVIRSNKLNYIKVFTLKNHICVDHIVKVLCKINVSFTFQSVRIGKGSQPSRHQGPAIAQVQGLRQGTVRMEALLLVSLYLLGVTQWMGGQSDCFKGSKLMEQVFIFINVLLH